MTQRQINQTMLSISAEEGFSLKRKDTPLASAQETKQAAILATDINQWEEVPLLAIQEAKAEAERVRRYEARVVELIRERYTADDETAILRKYIAINSQPHPFSDEKMDEIVREFDDYNAFAEECKLKAKEGILKTEQL